MSITPDEAARRRRRHRNERIVAATGVIVLLAAVVAFHRWNVREEERFAREKTYIPPPVEMTPEIRLLQEYVRIDTSNPPGNEIAGARFLAEVLARSGVRSEIIESVPGRASLYARIRGRRRGEGLLLLSHIDVVPADRSKWTNPPFEGTIRLATMYGRGTLDTKGLAICQLAGFLDVARSGRQPERDIAFLAVADEERGGKLGTAWLIEHRPELFDGIRYAIGEGGITEMIADRLTYFAIEIGTKQWSKVTLEADRREPLDKARWLLQPYLSSPEPERILPEVREYFRFIAPTRIAYRRQLADIDGTVERGEFWILPLSYRHLTQTVMNIHAPRRTRRGWEAAVFLLTLPDEDPRSRVESVRRMVEPLGIRVLIDQIEPATPLSTHHTPLFGIMAAEASREYHARVGTVILHGASNDSRFLRRLGIQAYGLLPYPVDWFQTTTIHGINEQIRLDRFMKGVELVRRIVRRWAFDE